MPCHLTFYLFNNPSTTKIYTLSLHDALPISFRRTPCEPPLLATATTCSAVIGTTEKRRASRDRKSTRLNSSHLGISYAVFCLKKKKKIIVNAYVSLNNHISLHSATNIIAKTQ